MKFTCFIDASSYINLSIDDCYLNGKTLLNILESHTTIKFSSKVNYEISRHHNPKMPSSLSRSSKVYRLSHRRIGTYIKYEENLFDIVSTSTGNNIGEKHNLAALIDCYLQNKTKGLIYLTDDQKALRGILNEPISSFPICQIWNSFDVILYLYLENKHFDVDIAKSAVRTLNAIISKNQNPQTDPRKTQERLKVFKDYNIRLDRIKKIKN